MKFNAIKENGDMGKSFIWVKEGDSIAGVFRGDFYEFKIHWVNSSSSSKKITCQGSGCDLCGSGNKSSFRFRVNFVHKNPATKEFVASIFEDGWKTYLSLYEFNKDVPLDKHAVRVSKVRDGDNKKHVIEKIEPLSEAGFKSVSSVPLQKLEDTSPYAGQEKEPTTFDDVPF